LDPLALAVNAFDGGRQLLIGAEAFENLQETLRVVPPREAQTASVNDSFPSFIRSKARYASSESVIDL